MRSVLPALAYSQRACMSLDRPDNAAGLQTPWLDNVEMLIVLALLFVSALGMVQKGVRKR